MMRSGVRFPSAPPVPELPGPDLVFLPLGCSPPLREIAVSDTLATYRFGSGQVAAAGGWGNGVSGNSLTPRVAYRGFVSYSHKDAGIGRLIHRRLEAYRLPGHLVGSETPRGPVPARLTPIFRDREELSAGESLSEQVQAALAASDCLLVLCSPNAKASKWVAKEIETFRALHPEKPVLAALIAGEPDEAYPEPLTAHGAEPVAADFRKGGDGRQLALLKLVAGMTGVGLDALVQRDAQRKLRGVMIVTLSALVGLLITALLLVAALRARAEADHQRAEAEGLVEFMLTDLRDRLKGVGRLDVMTAVNERAMGYYEQQGNLTKLPPESLNRRARILHAMGEDDESKGELAAALKKFQEANRVTAAVLAKQPADPDALFAHAQSEFWLGQMHYFRNEPSAVLPRWTAYRDLTRRLVRAAPSDPRSMRELAYAEGNLCSLALDPPQNLDNAVSSCAVSLKGMQHVERMLPHDLRVKRDVANRRGWLATAYAARGDRRTALAERTAQVSITEALSKQLPEDKGIAEINLAAQISMAQLLGEMGQTQKSQQRLIIAKRMQQQLERADPTNKRWQGWKKQIAVASNMMKGNDHGNGPRH
jgi:tetratricopeptide (TPR) repeat protein